MSTETEVFERVQKIVMSIFDVDAEKVKPETKFVDDLGADSITTMDIVMELEKDFNLDQIPDDVVQNIDSVQDIVDYIAKVQTA